MKLLITGANGMLGRSLVNYAQIDGHDICFPTRNELDLSNQAETLHYLEKHQPEAVIHAAARVGGISANIQNPLPFLTENILIDSSVLGAARIIKVPNLIYIGSSCMYPKNLSHPMKENEILTGELEPTNEAYALAKIVGSKIAQLTHEIDSLNWRTVVLSNLYGPHDHFEADRSHVLSAIIAKTFAAKDSRAKNIEMWGDGSARREFTFVEDVANFLIQSLSNLKAMPSIMNVGAGVDFSIRDYYTFVMSELDFKGELIMDLSKPTGMRQKLMDISLARTYGWKPTTDIHAGIKKTINWYGQSLNTGNC